MCVVRPSSGRRPLRKTIRSRRSRRRGSSASSERRRWLDAARTARSMCSCSYGDEGTTRSIQCGARRGTCASLTTSVVGSGRLAFSARTPGGRWGEVGAPAGECGGLIALLDAEHVSEVGHDRMLPLTPHQLAVILHREAIKSGGLTGLRRWMVLPG